MKKRLFLMAMASVALASCVSEAVTDVKQKDEKVKITFESPVLYNSINSRAIVHGEIGSHTYPGSSTVYSYPREEKFVIYAVQHDGDLGNWGDAEVHGLNGKTVEYDNTVDGWTAKDDANKYYYWPAAGKKMSFAASSPAELEVTDASRNYGNNGLTITGFEIQADAEKQYDLLYSEIAANKTAASMTHGAGYYSGVPIKFYHALSSIRFSILNETEETVVLKSIEVYGVKYKGDFTQNSGWDLDNAVVEGTAPYTGYSGSVTFPDEAQYVAYLDATNSNQLLLMPQDLSDEAVVKVTYEVNGTEQSPKIAVFKDWKDTNDNPVTKWEMGHRYIYRLVYSAATAKKDKIFFSPSTEDWVEEDIVVIKL